MCADFIHSKEGGEANDRVLEKLERHELDVIAQVRMLGEGFDHPYLSVAGCVQRLCKSRAVRAIVGRVMRVIEPNAPGSPLIRALSCSRRVERARVWSDFRDFSTPDQEYFDKLLLPVEELHFETSKEM